MSGIPWEDPEVGFPENLGRTWIESLTAPVPFFRRLAPEAVVAAPESEETETAAG